ncbi:uncharacterized protein [Fopius arisanus]|uniref:Telomeric repeat-binding factor 2-interacting protein 1 n=1 Tax=Fopius arisanus TaxID=64838 RepID=A0A0C9RDL2_9HYME|nr:PREDICTED: uncharacterized protein LOC105271772 [Fopius arisanus]
MAFTYELFRINGQSMRFSLVGYTEIEVLQMATIVEAFGGKLSEPGDNTLVFSYPGAPIGENYSHFDSKFLFDSVTTGKLQKLDDYRIPLTETNSSLQAEDFNSINHKTRTESSSENDPGKSKSENNLYKSTAAAAEPSIEAIAARDEKHLQETSRRSRNRKQKRKSSSSPSRERADEKKVELFPSHANLLVKRKYLPEENQKIMDYIINNKMISFVGSSLLWKNMEAKQLLTNPTRTWKGLKSHFKDYLRDNVADYTDDPDVIRQFAEERAQRYLDFAERMANANRGSAKSISQPHQ